jgi:hypothetical protein
MNENDLANDLTPDDEAISAVLREKLSDAFTPSYEAEFAHEEAIRAGAFAEDALSEQDAAESAVDLMAVVSGVVVGPKE